MMLNLLYNNKISKSLTNKKLFYLLIRFSSIFYFESLKSYTAPAFFSFQECQNLLILNCDRFNKYLCISLSINASWQWII